jgi:hypothetical protein
MHDIDFVCFVACFDWFAVWLDSELKKIVEKKEVGTLLFPEQTTVSADVPRQLGSDSAVGDKYIKRDFVVVVTGAFFAAKFPKKKFPKAAETSPQTSPPASLCY